MEIKTLLDELNDPRAAGERLLSSIENAQDGLQAENIVPLCRFFLNGGLYQGLIEFVLRHFRKPDFIIPWPYFLEAIALSRPEVTELLAKELMKGIDEQRQREQASRSKALDVYFPEMKSERADRRLQALKSYRREKDQLIEQLYTLRTQQLFEQEKLVLQKLQKMFPTDEDVLREARNHKDRYALEILSRHSRFQKTQRFEENFRDTATEALKPNFAAALKAKTAEQPALGLDFAIAAAMLELWEDALEILSMAEDSVAVQWLRLEILLQAGRHLELLNEIGKVEVTQSANPDTFIATAYLRAQAHWGLGQKHSAIEIMESLLAAFPQYRAGLSLLTTWRNQ